MDGAINEQTEPLIVPLLMKPELSKPPKPEVVKPSNAEPEKKRSLFNEMPAVHRSAPETQLLIQPQLLTPPKSKKKQIKKRVDVTDEKTREPRWDPTDEQYLLVKELAELGWPSVKVAEALNVSPQMFAGALIRHPRLKDEYDQGVAECKAFPERKLAWRPSSDDVRDVYRYAAKGLGQIEIAARINVSRWAMTARMQDTPQLKEAFEQGEGEYRANLMEQADELLRAKDSSLKYLSGMLIFKLKAHCDLNDKEPKQIVEVSGDVIHKHQLAVPAPVPINQIVDFAKAEMERATNITGEKLKLVAVETVDAEVVDG